MPTITPVPVDAPDATSCSPSTSRCAQRAFPGTRYTTVFPDPSVFEPPAGVFVVVSDDEARPVGCGGIRRIDDGPQRAALRGEAPVPAARDPRARLGPAAAGRSRAARASRSAPASSCSTPTTRSKPRAGCTRHPGSSRSTRTTTTRTRRAGTGSALARPRPGRPRAGRCAARRAGARGRCARAASTAGPASARSRSARSAPD